MSDSVLAHVALSYQPVLGAARDIIAVALEVRPVPGSAPDGAHLMAVLREFWGARAPQLLLRVGDPGLLGDLLAHAAVAPAWIVVDRAALLQPALADAARAASQRGVQLVERGPLGEALPPGPAPRFALTMSSLSMDQTLQALACCEPADLLRRQRLRPPELAGQLCEGIASERLASWCLDQAHAAGVVDWPVEEAVHRPVHGPTPPDRQVITALMRAIDQDVSIEALEQRLGMDPVLAYRFLRYANSAALGLRADMDSLRHSLMMVGAANLRKWLVVQLEHAGGWPNLRPLREAAVLRARLAEQLVDAGSEHELRRELYLCGLLADLHLLTGEPWGQLLPPVPLVPRVTDAIVHGLGPYAPYLELARAMAQQVADPVADVCARHELGLEEANRTLLRVLGSTERSLPDRRPAQASLPA